MVPCPRLDATAPAAPPKRALAILFFTIFIDLLGFGILMPVMPTFARHYGASETVIGMLFATFSLTQLISAPFWGRLSDRVGRRPVLIVAALGSSLCHLGFALSTDLWLLFVARALVGACGGSISTAHAYVADITPPEQRTRGMALVGAAIGLGFTIGPGLSGLIASHGGVRAPFYVAAALALANAIWAYIALPEPAHRHRSARGPLFASLGASLRLPGVGFWLVMLFVITYAFAHVEASLVLWTTDLMHFTPRDNGLVFTWIGVVLVLAQMGGTRRLAKVMPETTLATLGCAMMAIGTVLTPAFPHWGPLMALMGLMAFGNALTSPAVMSAISRAAPPEAQGEILGVSQSVSALGRIAGPPASGILYQHVGRWSPWVTCGALLAIAAAAISVFARGASPRSTPTGR